MSGRGQRPRDAAAGIGIVELIVTTLITVMVIGGLMTMATSMQFVHADLDTRTNAFQSTRIALDRIQRDLLLAGVGLTPMLPVFPLIMPRDGGGITIRHNEGGQTSLLRADMKDDVKVPVPDGHGFQVGDIVAIYDGTGSLDMGTVAKTGDKTIQMSAGLSKRYRRGDGAAVARVVSVSYYLESSGGTRMLMRQVDTEAASPIALDVARFELVFFDDSQPPAPFTPTTSFSQLRIGMVDVRLQVTTPTERVQAGDRPTFELQTRIAPRALSVSRS